MHQRCSEKQPGDFRGREIVPSKCNSIKWQGWITKYIQVFTLVDKKFEISVCAKS